MKKLYSLLGLTLLTSTLGACNSNKKEEPNIVPGTVVSLAEDNIEDFMSFGANFSDPYARIFEYVDVNLNLEARARFYLKNKCSKMNYETHEQEYVDVYSALDVTYVASKTNEDKSSTITRENIVDSFEMPEGYDGRSATVYKRDIEYITLEGIATYNESCFGLQYVQLNMENQNSYLGFYIWDVNIDNKRYFSIHPYCPYGEGVYFFNELLVTFKYIEYGDDYREIRSDYIICHITDLSYSVWFDSVDNPSIDNWVLVLSDVSGFACLSNAIN